MREREKEKEKGRDIYSENGDTCMLIPALRSFCLHRKYSQGLELRVNAIYHAPILNLGTLKFEGRIKGLTIM